MEIKHAENTLWGYAFGVISSKYFYAWLPHNIDSIEALLSNDATIFLDLISSDQDAYEEQIEIRRSLLKYLKLSENYYDFERVFIDNSVKMLEQDFKYLPWPDNYTSIAAAANLDNEFSDFSSMQEISLQEKAMPVFWMDIDDAVIKQYPDALNFMSLENLIFHMPAYMRDGYKKISNNQDVMFNNSLVMYKKIFAEAGNYNLIVKKLSEVQIYRVCDFMQSSAIHLTGGGDAFLARVKGIFETLGINSSHFFIGR